MRKFTSIFLAMVMVVSFASFTFAGDASVDGDNGVAIGIDNNNTNNNTANANANASANQSQDQRQKQMQQQMLQNSYISPIQPYNPNAPGPMLSGPELSLGEWGLFTTTLFSSVTFEQAASLSGGYSYSSFWSRDRLGTEAIMTRNLAQSSSVVITEYWGRMNGDEYIASFPVFGKRGDQLEGLIGLALKRSMELGATKVGILIRKVKEINTKGLSIGSGAGAGLYIPCNSGVGTGVNFGAYINNTRTEDMYELNVVCLKGGVYVPPPPAPPAPPEVKQPEPPPCPPQEPPCDLTKIWERIHELEREVQKCTRYCFNNLKLRYALEKEYIELYVCTKEKRYLDSAIYHAEVAERNYRKGYDIAAHRAEADQVISEVWYLQAGAINLTRGVGIADEFAASKKLERYPKGFAR